MIQGHDVGVDEALDEGRGEAIAFYIDAGFVADFAVAVVEFEVAEDHAVVGAGDEFGGGGLLVRLGGDGGDGVEAEGLLLRVEFGVAGPLAVVAAKGEAEGGGWVVGDGGELGVRPVFGV